MELRIQVKLRLDIPRSLKKESTTKTYDRHQCSLEVELRKLRSVNEKSLSCLVINFQIEFDLTAYYKTIRVKNIPLILEKTRFL